MASDNVQGIEGETLDHVLHILAGNLNLNVVLDALLSKGLINAELLERLDSLTNNGRTSSAVRQAVTAIKRNPPGYLNTFIQVLKNYPQTDYLGDMIDKGMSAINRIVT